MNRMIDTQMIAAMMFTSSITVLSMMILWFSIFEQSPLSYRNVPFPVSSSNLYPGDEVIFKVKRCSSANASTAYVVTKYVQSLDGNTMISIGRITKKLSEGCETQVIDKTYLPLNMLPGEYRLVGIGETQGTITPHTVFWYSESFYVGPK